MLLRGYHWFLTILVWRLSRLHRQGTPTTKGGNCIRLWLRARGQVQELPDFFWPKGSLTGPEIQECHFGVRHELIRGWCAHERVNSASLVDELRLRIPP